jgi:hypothetical protein
MRRILTLLTFPMLLLSAWDCLPVTRINLQRWSRLRERGRVAPDTDWDRSYAQAGAQLPPLARVGLVQVAQAGTPARERQYYFLQYALAPRLVMPGADEEFVIAYGPRAAAPSLLDPSAFVQVWAFEDEFALYRRSRR